MTGQIPVFEFWPLFHFIALVQSFYSYGLYYYIVSWKDSNKQTLLSSPLLPAPLLSSPPLHDSSLLLLLVICALITHVL